MVGKFSAKNLGRMPGQMAGGRLTIFYKETGMDESIAMCQAEHWAFDSCAAIAMSGFGREWNASSYWKKPEIVKAFIDFLEKGEFTCELDHWKPKEFLFLLSKSQLKGGYYAEGVGTMSELVKHPKMYLRDKWKNKSHDGEVFLYRLSFEEDVTILFSPKEPPVKKVPKKAKEIAA